MLTRIKYVSRFARALSIQEVRGIVETAQARNSVVGVTGVLLTFGDVFMQILEGSPGAVTAVLARIVNDRRHRDLVVLRRQDVERRIFGEWSMRLLELGDDARCETAPLLERIESIGIRRWPICGHCRPSSAADSWFLTADRSTGRSARARRSRRKRSLTP